MSKSAAAVFLGKKAAMLVVFSDEQNGKFTYISGQPLSNVGDLAHYEKNFGEEDYGEGGFLLPGINVLSIVRALQQPRAKHSSFSSKGNAFSRIAHLIQQGYQGTFAGAVQPQSSGVLFKWTHKDLEKYRDKWVKSVGKHSLGGEHSFAKKEEDLGSFFRTRGLYKHAAKDFYYFIDDTTVKAMTHQEREAALKKLKDDKFESDRGKKMVNFS